MRQFYVSATFVLAIGVVLSAQSAPGDPTGPQGPDLSGRWNRESVSGDTRTADSSMWGSRIEIDHSGVNVTVRPGSGKAERHRLDGTEIAEVVSVDGCSNVTRITKWLAGRDRVTITTWLVVKPACLHGEVDDEPFVLHTGPIEVRDVRGGRRRLESIAAVFREGDVLTFDTTRATPGGAPTNTTTTYRKQEPQP